MEAEVRGVRLLGARYQVVEQELVKRDNT